jgi:CRISPR/Cas system CSM-associated protein Csm2 small subunit
MLDSVYELIELIGLILEDKNTLFLKPVSDLIEKLIDKISNNENMMNDNKLKNLINKNIIKLDIVPIEPNYSSIDENKKYKYILTRVKENEGKMDNIEAYVHGLFFNYSYNNGTTIRLDEAIEELKCVRDTIEGE